MKKIIFLFVAIIFTLTSCKKKKDPTPTPTPTTQNCSPLPGLDGAWVSDSARYIATDSNSVIITDTSYVYAPPNDYLKLWFFCYNNKPTMYLEDYGQGVLLHEHDSLTYAIKNNTIYLPDSPSDTIYEKFNIQYLSGNVLHMKLSYISLAPPYREDYYIYMKK